MSAPFLFVSHVTEDRAAATELVAELERRGVGCWVAPRDVRAGKPYDDEIAEAIDDCVAMLLIFSERCNESEYIRREITVAGEARKLVIPFRIENAQPKRGLRIRLADLHWIDGFIARQQGIEAIIRSVAEGRHSYPGENRTADIPPVSNAASKTRPATGNADADTPETIHGPTASDSAPAPTGYEGELREKEASANPADQFIAGMMHWIGLSPLFKTDRNKALTLFHRAADQGHAGAQHQIGVRLRDGRPPDPGKAAEWFSKAAAQGHRTAICDLARLYESGEGVSADKSRALALYKQAVADGAFWAEGQVARLSGLALEPAPKPFAESDAKSEADECETELQAIGGNTKQKIMEALEDSNISSGDANLGDIVRIVERAKAGDALAQFVVGRAYSGNAEHAKARPWLRRSAVCGFAPAQRMVGEFYRYGLGGQADKSEAAIWFERAARSGSTMALLDLADMYLMGEGVVQDFDMAKAICEEVLARCRYFREAYYAIQRAKSYRAAEGSSRFGGPAMPAPKGGKYGRVVLT